MITKILYKTLPCLVRMCRKESRRTEKALGAETLAYLIEVDTELQVSDANSKWFWFLRSNFISWFNIFHLESRLNFGPSHPEFVLFFLQEQKRFD